MGNTECYADQFVFSTLAFYNSTIMQTVKECQGVKIDSSYMQQPCYPSKAVGFMPQMAHTNLVDRAQRGTRSVHVHDAAS